MVYDDGAWAVLGSVDGATTHLAEQIVAKARLPLVSPVSTDASVNLAGVPWMFSVAPGDHLWAPPLVEALLAATGDGPFVLIATTDHDARQASRSLLEALARRDRAPAFRLDLEPGTADFAPGLERLDLAGQAAILLAADPIDGARLLRAIDAAGFSGLIFGTPRLARRHCLESAGRAAEGLVVPVLDAPSDGAREAIQFRQRFRERTGVDPDWAATHTYDATRLLVDAVRAAGASRAGIRESLAGLSGWRGASGIVEWDPSGQNERPVPGVGTVRDGRLKADWR